MNRMFWDSKMTKEVDRSYYAWLVSQIALPSNDKTYNELFTRMHHTEFVWVVDKDDNRVQDGKDLRYLYLGEKKNRLTLGGATCLEIVISLSKTLAFTAGGRPKPWAWRLIKNLHLNRMSDPLSEGQARRVDDILYTLIWREYEQNGNGGFFPLKNPQEDQTKVEIWYQLNAYVIELDHS